MNGEREERKRGAPLELVEGKLGPTGRDQGEAVLVELEHAVMCTFLVELEPLCALPCSPPRLVVVVAVVAVVCSSRPPALPRPTLPRALNDGRPEVPQHAEVHLPALRECPPRPHGARVSRGRGRERHEVPHEVVQARDVGVAARDEREERHGDVLPRAWAGRWAHHRVVQRQARGGHDSRERRRREREEGGSPGSFRLGVASFCGLASLWTLLETFSYTLPSRLTRRSLWPAARRPALTFFLARSAAPSSRAHSLTCYGALCSCSHRD